VLVVAAMLARARPGPITPRSQISGQPPRPDLNTDKLSSHQLSPSSHVIHANYSPPVPVNLQRTRPASEPARHLGRWIGHCQHGRLLIPARQASHPQAGATPPVPTLPPFGTVPIPPAWSVNPWPRLHTRFRPPRPAQDFPRLSRAPAGPTTASERSQSRSDRASGHAQCGSSANLRISGRAANFRQKFNKPRANEFIRVRHQHYQGEHHPAARKVDISFQLADVPLTSDKARHKFALLAGPRLNHATGEVKIACERFPTEQMNEKWCSDVLERMVTEAEVRLRVL